MTGRRTSPAGPVHASSPEQYAAVRPTVSVLLPTHNRAGLLDRALRSVASQTYPASEVIVVDDASTDDTSDVLARWAGQLPLHVVRLESAAGPSGARNRGLDVARGEFVAFLDDDDEWLPQMLETQIDLLRSSEHDVAYAPYVLVDQNGRESVDSFAGVDRDTFRMLLRGNFIALPTVVARRSVLHRSGGFNEELRILVDWELWLRLAPTSSFVRATEPLARVHQLTESVSSRHDARQHACLLIERTMRLHSAGRAELLSDGLYALGMELLLRGVFGPGRDYLRRSLAADPWPPKKVIVAALAHVAPPLCVVAARAHGRWLRRRRIRPHPARALMSGGAVSASVVIPTWNGRDMLLHALGSLAAQTFTDFETIVVDNGSSDGTADAVAAEFPHVRVIALPENRGFAAAVNEGIRAAGGDIVVLLNNDTEAEPQWLAELVRALAENPEAGSAMSKMLDDGDRTMIDSAGLQLGLFASNIGEGRPDGPEFAAPQRIFGACGGAAAYRRSALDEVGLLDDAFFAYAEDVDLAARLQLAGHACVYAPGAVVYHRGSATTSRVPALRFHLLMRNSIIVFLRYASPRRLLWTPLVLAWPFARAVIDRQRPTAPARAVFQALCALRSILRVRRHIAQTRRLSTREFDALLAHPLTRAGTKAPSQPRHRNRTAAVLAAAVAAEEPR